MKIGSLDIGNKAILAPMAEITDAPFRQMCKEFGAGLTFTQMVSAQGIINNSFTTLKYLAFNRQEKPIGIQLLGNKPEFFEKAINELQSFSPDLFDLNCGCSAQKVCKVGMGAGLLDNPALLSQVVKVMVKAANGIPVSVKLRLGPSRQKINIIENARMIEDCGASFITVHVRTRADEYLDKPMWEYLPAVKQAVSIPVVGNGSIFCPEEGVRILKETGCDSLFIARGALGNPFIFDRLNKLLSEGKDPGQPGVLEVAQAAIRHFRLLIKDAGPIEAVPKARKHLIWYFMTFNGITEFIKNIYSLKLPEQVEEFIGLHAEKVSKDQYPEEDLLKIKESFNNRVLFWI